jgi:hypothetical protein
MEFLINVFGNKDTVCSILDYCTPYINLGVFGPDSKEFQSVMKRDIERKLELYGTADIIIPRLNDNYQLMGSELLQILYGETWENSDVDIITNLRYGRVRNNNYHGLIDERDRNKLNESGDPNEEGYTTDDLHNIDIDKITHGGFYEKITPYKMLVEYIQYKKVLYNIVVVANEVVKLPDLVCEHYDLDICKILYNGKKLFIPHWKELLERRSSNLQKGIHEIIYNDRYYRNGMEKLCTLTNRIAKYKKRGFQIDVDYVELIFDLFDEMNNLTKYSIDTGSYQAINTIHIKNNSYILHYKKCTTEELRNNKIKQVTRLKVL